ncbi:MAG: CPBP family intramembrane metalloprotease [Clostridia bacterium]|nr:CPBP family intramembrane metalloprotease [Clostridia bacterium]
MFGTESGRMLAEAKEASFKPHWALQILIFFLVFFVAQIALTTFAMLPTFVWLVAESGFIAAAVRGDAEAAMAAALAVPDWLRAVQLFLTAAETGCALLYCRCIEKRSARSMGFTRRGWLRQYLSGYAVGAGMMLAACGLSVLLGGVTLSLSASISACGVALFFAGYIVQGMAEEVLVRGYFMLSFAGSLKSRHAAAIAVGVSSLLFAAMHLANPGMTPLSFANLLLAGLFFALYALRTDNIWGASAAHAAWNFFQGHILGSEVSGLTSSASVFKAQAHGAAWLGGGSFGLEGGVAVCAVLLLAILLLLFVPKRNEKASAAVPE